MSESNDELEFEPDEYDEYEEGLEEEVSEYEEDEPDEDEELDSVPNRGRAKASATQLESELQAANEKIADLENRLGNALRVHGQRIKERDQEIKEWKANVRTWLDEQITAARAEAFAEGVRETERILLPLVPTEDKSSYLEEQRLKPVTVSQRPVPVFEEPKPRSTTDASDEDITSLVRQFTAMGIPSNRLDQSSAEALIESAGSYWNERFRALEEKIEQGPSRETRAREEAGKTRVSTGTGAPRFTRSKDQARLEEIEQRLARLKATGKLEQASSLLAEKRAIQARLARVRQR